MKLTALFAALGALLTSLAAPAGAGQTQVAVAANFTEPAKEIAAVFKQKTGHEAVLIFGASGAFYTQITHDAPFQVFLSADAERPKAAVDAGLAVPGSLFTYAIGKLVLWSKVLDVTKGEETLKAGAFSKLAIANPVAAPYGTAAVETMKALGVYDALKPKIVQGTASRRPSSSSTPRTRSWALSRSRRLPARRPDRAGSFRQISMRRSGRTPCCSTKAQNDEASIAFLAFLKGPEARAIIEKFGYGLD